ncbi:MAG: tetratricopeptide repeat protein [Candidatus Sabulitectum sp.]|nr:tetratricopeptide repeat protein [Candidatus Sabulitectum sp.]
MTDSIQMLEDRLKSVSDNERFDLLINLSQRNFKVSPAKARSYAEEALVLSVSAESRPLEAKALNALGKARLGQLAPAKALKHLLDALSIYEKLDSKQGIADVLGNIAQVHHLSGERDDALKCLGRSRTLYEELGCRKQLSRNLNLTGLVLISADRDEEALKRLTESLEIALEEDDVKTIRSATNNIGILHYRNGNFEEAITCFRKAAELSRQEKELRSLAGNYINIGTSNIQLGNYTDAREYLNRGLELAEQSEALDFIMQGCHSLCELYEKEEDFKKALEYNRKMSELERKVFTMEKSKAIAEIHDKYQTEKAENESEIHRLKNIELVEKKQLIEAQLLQSQKLDTVGRLAGGIAHDFNNLLTVIKGHADFILLDIAETHPIWPDVEGISKAADRASLLTQQLLAFSRQQILRPRPLDLSKIVSGLQRMLSRLLSENIQIVTSFPQNPGCVFADESQIEQVIVNLVINARDAMESGGKLTIEVSDLDIDEQSLITNPDLHPGRYMQLSISDTGCGMNAEIQARIFEPFFSTKPGGKGSGLGLAMVYGIVKQSGGVIEVSSEPAVGTTFMMYLPRIEGENIHDEEQTVQSSESGNGESILIVEDDKTLRNLVERYLFREGYEVMSAESAEEALKLYKDSENLQLLLTDIVLPGINGVMLASQLKETGYNGRILYMTGYTKNEIIPDDIRKDGKSLLEKPFSLATLHQKIRNLLDTM